jgi:hypothetical protein
MLRTLIGLIFGIALVACSGNHTDVGNPSTTGGTPTGPGVTTSGPTGSSTGGTTTGGAGGSMGTGGSTGTGGGMQQLTVRLTGNGQGTVTSMPAGLNCSNMGGGSPCSAWFATGTMVTLTATASSSARFDGWMNGPCSGSAPCTVTLDGPREVTAVFTQANVLTVTLAGDGTGKVVGLLIFQQPAKA